MKKVILSLIAMVFLINISFSQTQINCESFDANFNNQDYSLDLSFNNGEEFENTSLILKRKWWQAVGQVCAVVAGDAGGAAAMVWASQGLATAAGAATAGTGYAVVATGAAIVGAVGGSYAAYCGTGGNCRRVGNFNSTNPEGTPKNLDFPKDFDFLEDLGNLHNQALENVYFSGLIEEKDWLLQNLKNVESINFEKFYNSKELNELKNKIVNLNLKYKDGNYNLEVLLNDFKNQKLINDVVYSNLLNYFNETFKVLTFKEFYSITDRYIENVLNSKFSMREKESLLAAYSVSVKSFYYWYNFELNE